MKVENPRELAQLLKGKKNCLLLTGEMGNEIEFNGVKLLDLAAQLAQVLSVPVAATGNTVNGLRERGVDKVEKMWVGEVVEFMHSKWLDPVTPQRPQTLLFLGYNPYVVRQLISAISGAETVVLGPSYVEEATYSIPDVSLKDWRQYLEGLVKAVKG